MWIGTQESNLLTLWTDELHTMVTNNYTRNLSLNVTTALPIEP